jgi:hypothetical protein
MLFLQITTCRVALSKSNASLPHLRSPELLKTAIKPINLDVLAADIPCISGIFREAINRHSALIHY